MSGNSTNFYHNILVNFIFSVAPYSSNGFYMASELPQTIPVLLNNNFLKRGLKYSPLNLV